MIIFVGDQSSKKNTDPSIPFVGTKSYKKLLDWIWEMDLSINEIQICNKEDVKEYRWGGEYYIDGQWYVDLLSEDRIVALGCKAKKRLDELELEHFSLPHPSGRNRKLNGPEGKKFIKQKLKECKKWLKKTKCS